MLTNLDHILISFSNISIGIVFSFLVLSIFISYKSREKSFIAYSVYLLFILLYLFSRNLYIQYLLTEKFIINNIHIVRTFQIIAFSAYVYFVLYFLDINKSKPVFFHRIKRIINGSLVLSGLLIAYTVITNNTELYKIYYFKIFLIYTIVMTIVVLYGGVRKIKNVLKYYFLVGTSIYFCSVVLSAILTLFKGVVLSPEFPPILIFYWGLIVEIVVFSAGLSIKIHQEYSGRIQVEKDLLQLQNKQNILLENRIKQKEKELLVLHKKNELAKVNEVKYTFQSEISNLKVVALQSQMNPHFIFNSLNSIKLYIINSEKEKAVYYLNKFSKLIRTILMGSTRIVTNLEDELEFIKLYLNIENIRFDNKINITFDINKHISLKEIKLPSLILQPFLENSLWHGFFSKKGEKNILVSVIKLNENYCKISIKDNGVGRKKALEIKKSKSIQNKSIGLDLTKKRLELFSDTLEHKASFRFIDLKNDQNEPIGTEVELLIPYI